MKSGLCRLALLFFVVTLTAFGLAGSATGQVSVTITSPTDGQVFPSTTNAVTIRVTAGSDAAALIELIEYYDGSRLLFSHRTNRADVSSSLPLTDLAQGTYTITVVATDSLNRSGEAEVTFHINEKPGIELLEPEDGATFFAQGSLVLSAEVVDDAEVTNLTVTFFANNVPIGTNTAEPYFITWSNLVAGTYELTASVRDLDGETNVSDKVTITVEPNPEVEIVSPPDGSGFLTGTNVTFTMEATNHLGAAITSYSVYHGGTNLIGTSTNNHVTWSNLVAGTYSVTAQVIDENGGEATSDPITVRVANLVFVKPLDGEVFFTNQLIEIEAVGIETGLTNVVISSGTNTLLTATNPPYTTSLTADTAGTVELSAVATDDTGVETTDTISVSVVDRLPIGMGRVTTNYVLGVLAQSVSITNPTSQELGPIQLLIMGLPEGVGIYNASGIDGSGIPFLHYNGVIAAGSVLTLSIEYVVRDRRPPAGMEFEAVLSTNLTFSVPPGTALPSEDILRVDMVGGVYYLEFQAGGGTNEYYIQYATNMAAPDWETAYPPIRTIRSNPVLWYDTGPPRTARPPEADGMRVYQVIRVTP